MVFFAIPQIVIFCLDIKHHTKIVYKTVYSLTKILVVHIPKVYLTTNLTIFLPGVLLGGMTPRHARHKTPISQPGPQDLRQDRPQASHADSPEIPQASHV